MSVNEPIDPRVRLAISQWPDDAPRGAVSTFCSEHGISRKSFYELRKRVKTDGPAAVLEPRTRRPKASPSKISDEVKTQAVAVRAALEASGLDHGPISVHDKMHAMGLEQVPQRRRWHESSVRPAWLVSSRRRSPDRHGGGSSIQPRMRAGNSTGPSTCSAVGVRV